MTLERTTLELVVGDARLVVDPAAGARAVSWTVSGLELLGRAADDQAHTPVGAGMYVMAPWPGRLRDNTVTFGGRRHPMPPGPSGWALHGTLLDSPWDVESDPADAAAGSVTLGADLAPPWPWAGRVRVTWQLGPDALRTTLQVTSAGESFPAAAGWHPWFRRTLDRGGPVQVDVPGQEMLERGPDHLPTGRVLARRPTGPYDDTFPLPGGRAELRWPGALRLECRTDCPYVVLFDEQPTAVCLEPQTAPPDALNTDPTLVGPDRPLTAMSLWSWTVDSG